MIQHIDTIETFYYRGTKYLYYNRGEYSIQFLWYLLTRSQLEYASTHSKHALYDVNLYSILIMIYHENA